MMEERQARVRVRLVVKPHTQRKMTSSATSRCEASSRRYVLNRASSKPDIRRYLLVLTVRV